MEQTVVEWLIEQFKEYDFEDSPTMYIMQIPSWVLEKKELQAKEMEKQQQGYSEEDLKNAFFSGCQSERQIKPRIKCWEEWFELNKKK